MSSSDDDAPEEIALSAGKSQAATLRSQEHAQQKQRSTSQRKRRRASEVESNAANPSSQIGASAQSGSPETGPDLGAVPDEVIEALTAADK